MGSERHDDHNDGDDDGVVAWVWFGEDSVCEVAELMWLWFLLLRCITSGAVLSERHQVIWQLTVTIIQRAKIRKQV